MKLLAVLFSAFVAALSVIRIFWGDWDFYLAGNIGMAVFIIFTGVSHFKFQKGMAMMIPDIFPAKIFLVYFTGFLEIAAGIGLLIPELRKISAVLLIIFLISVFVANIKSSRENINIYNADRTGPGMDYLWKQRLPMQIILLGWLWYFSLYLP